MKIEDLADAMYRGKYIGYTGDGYFTPREKIAVYFRIKHDLEFHIIVEARPGWNKKVKWAPVSWCVRNWRILWNTGRMK